MKRLSGAEPPTTGVLQGGSPRRYAAPRNRRRLDQPTRLWELAQVQRSGRPLPIYRCLSERHSCIRQEKPVGSGITSGFNARRQSRSNALSDVLNRTTPRFCSVAGNTTDFGAFSTARRPVHGSGWSFSGRTAVLSPTRNSSKRRNRIAHKPVACVRRRIVVTRLAI